MLQYRFALTTDDFILFNEYVQLKAPGVRKSIFKRYIPITVLLTFVIVINIFTQSQSANPDYSILIYIGFLAIAIVMSVLSMKSRVKKAALTFANNPQNAAFFNMVDYSFSETGIQLKDIYKDVYYQWAAFTKKAETENYYYLYIYSTTALVIPKRIFRSEVEKNQFASMLSQHISLQAEIGDV